MVQEPGRVGHSVGEPRYAEEARRPEATQRPAPGAARPAATPPAAAPPAASRPAPAACPAPGACAARPAAGRGPQPDPGPPRATLRRGRPSPSPAASPGRACPRSCPGPGGADGDPQGPRICLHQLPDRDESRRRPGAGAGPFHARRQVHGDAVGDRPRPGDEVGHPPDRGRDPGRADRRRLCRHRRQRHRPARHGQLRLARHPPRRQRGDPRRAQRRGSRCWRRRRTSWRCRPTTWIPTAPATSRSRAPPRAPITVADTAIAAQFKQGRTLSGRGIFLIPPSGVDPDTGEMTPVTTFAHAALVVDLRGRRRDRRGRR